MFMLSKVTVVLEVEPPTVSEPTKVEPWYKKALLYTEFVLVAEVTKLNVISSIVASTSFSSSISKA